MKIWEGLAKLDEAERAVKAKSYQQTCGAFGEIVSRRIVAPELSGQNRQGTPKLPDYDSLLDMLKEVKI